MNAKLGRPYKVTPEVEAEILAELQAGKSDREIAEQRGLSVQTVSRIRRGVYRGYRR